MSDVKWRDAKWWIATAATIVLGGMSLLYAYWLRATKRLVVEFVANAPIISPQRPNVPMFLVIGDRRVAQAYSRVLEVRSAGTQPILARDFDSPLTIQFASNAILSARVAASIPRDLSPTLTIAPAHDQLTIEPLLLNPSDSLTIEIITTEPAIKRVHARVAGISAIDINETPQQATSWRQAVYVPVGLIAVAIGAILYLAAAPFMRGSNHRVRTSELIIGGILLWLAGILLLQDVISSFLVGPHENVAAVFVALLLTCYIFIVGGIFRITRPKSGEKVALHPPVSAKTG